MSKILFAAITSALALALTVSAATGGPTVDLGYAKYQGLDPGTGVYEFLGIPYAAPPLAGLRWRAPQSPIRFRGIQNATKYHPICAGAGSYGASGQSEDCLYASVFTPSNATVNSKLPVLVWIQGGGYKTDANANYNGTTLALKGPMVVVTFNYRVGAFGFLASKEIKADGDLNVGLLDQRMLLQWVQKHISKFGGDPNHVVIDGASAGASSVLFHSAAYGGRDDDLFVGVISESLWMHSQPRVADLQFQYNDFANASGCAASSDTLDCLRNVNFTTLWIADVATTFPGRTAPASYPYGPVIDGKFLRKPLLEAFRSGDFVQTPLLIGNTANEGTHFAPNATTPSNITTFFLNNYQHLTPSSASAIPQIYPKESPLPKHAAYFPSAATAYGESTLICPANTLASYAVAWSNNSTSRNKVNQNAVYHYRYNVIDPANTAAGIGVTHTFEIGAVWGPTNVGNNVTAYISPNVNAAIVPVVMDYWVSFITTLDPNTRRAIGAPVWRKLDLEEPKRLRIQTNATMMEKWDGGMVQRCGFWEGLWGRQMGF